MEVVQFAGHSSLRLILDKGQLRPQTLAAVAAVTQ
jgi:hypothetical protein